ncbi:hypothetical protein ACFQHO_15615 [Actinomadura yumaensis]|uniref:hypothetical protein n=1 Tax=Actinomadura yumaensis TaxID=111807 RepID=UPI00360C11B3
MKRHPKVLARVWLSALVAGGALTAVTALPAEAAGPSAAAVPAADPARAAETPAPTLDDYYMRQANNLEDLTARVKELDAQLPKLGVKNILAQAPRKGTTADGKACNGKALDGTSTQRPDIDFSFCWDSPDSAASGNYEWTPQGVTTVADAQADKEWNGTKPFIASWYNCEHKNGAEDCTDNKKGARISFVDPNTGKYAHVLLAYPFKNDSGNATYMSLRTQQNAEGKSLHVGGMAWYGNYLYVADTGRGLRVFDMRYIFDLKSAGDKGNTTDKKQIGRQDGIFYGHGYRYVMPEVGAFTNNAPRPGTEKERCKNTGSPTTSYVSLDRSGTDHLITGEWCGGQTPPTGTPAGASPPGRWTATPASPSSTPRASRTCRGTR